MFKKVTESEVLVTMDGKAYTFRLLQNIPVQRYFAAKPILLQDELGMSFDGIWAMVRAIREAVMSETLSKGEMILKVGKVLDAWEQKLYWAENIVVVRLQMAALCWILDGEDTETLDMQVTLRKVEIMKSSDAAMGFFLTNPLPFGLSKLTVGADTLMFMLQMKAILTSMDGLPATYNMEI